MSREEKIAKARELRGLGWGFREIDRELGSPFGTAWRWLNPEKCKKSGLKFFEKNREACIAAGKAYAKERRDWLDAYKREQGCIDCGTTEGWLDFDHRPGETKVFNLGRPRAAWDKIKAEVAKCDVRCRSCHNKRHWDEGESLSQEQKVEIVQSRSQGVSSATLAVKFGVTKAAIDRADRRHRNSLAAAA